MLDVMNIRKINNFQVYLHNCDVIKDYHCIQIYKSLLHFLADRGIKLSKESYRWLTEMEKRSKLNELMDYYKSEGIIYGND